MIYPLVRFYSTNFGYVDRRDFPIVAPGRVDLARSRNRQSRANEFIRPTPSSAVGAAFPFCSFPRPILTPRTRTQSMRILFAVITRELLFDRAHLSKEMYSTTICRKTCTWKYCKFWRANRFGSSDVAHHCRIFQNYRGSGLLTNEKINHFDGLKQLRIFRNLYVRSVHVQSGPPARAFAIKERESVKSACMIGCKNRSQCEC